MVEAAGLIAIALVTLAMSLEPGGVVKAIPVLGALALGAQRLLPLLQQAYYGWSLASGNFRAFRDVIELMQAPIPDPQPHGRAARLRARAGLRAGSASAIPRAASTSPTSIFGSAPASMSASPGRPAAASRPCST